MVGDVILTPFPFTNLQDTKLRPAVVLADVGSKDWILCQITSRPARDRSIIIRADDMDSGELRLLSWARPDRLSTLNEGIFRRKVGQLTDQKLEEITAAVRDLF